MRRIYFFYGLALEPSDSPKSRWRLSDWFSSIRKSGNRKERKKQMMEFVPKENSENNY